MFYWLAPLYDLILWFISLFIGGEARFRAPVIDAVRPLEGTRVLEIFAGTATLSLLAEREGATVAALDVSPAMLGVAAAKAGRAGQRIPLVNADATCLPFADGSFDRVVVSMGLHEVEAPLVRAALKEAYRMLGPACGKGGSGGRGGRRGKLVILDFYRADGFLGSIQRIFFLFFESDAAGAWVDTDLQGTLREEGFNNFRRRFLLGGILQLVSVERRLGK